MNRKIKFTAIIASFLLSITLISCGGGGGGGGATGDGGPDLSPDTSEESLSPAGDSDTLELTSTGDDTSSVDPLLEGDPDSDSETGDGEDETLTSILGGTTSGSEEGTGSGDDTTGSGTAADSGDTTGSGTTSDSGEGTGSDDTTGSGTVADSGDTTGSGTSSGSEEGTGSGDTTGSGTVADSGDSTGSGTTSGSGEGTGSDDTTGSGTVADSGDTTGSGTETPDTGEMTVYQETGTEFYIDASQGEWFQETEGQLFSSFTSKAIKVKIEILKARIKLLIKYHRDKFITTDEAKEKIAALRAEIAELRGKIGNGDTEKGGITAKKGEQKLLMNITKGESGWYRLIVSAKNSGTLPASYDRFSFSIVDEDTGEIVGGLSVKASDKVYNTGITEFQLDNPAGKRLNLLWTNDAYSEGEYDTDLNIKKVILQKIKGPEVIASGNRTMDGDDFTFMDGRWFFDKTYAYTFWSGQTIGYTFRGLEEGVYEITVMAGNYGDLPLPGDYKEFKVDIDSDYDSASVSVPAHKSGWKQGKTTINFAAGDTTLYLTWTNDKYSEGEYDANIMIKSIKIKKIESSNLTAYLLRTKPGNKVFILSAFLILSGILMGIYIKNRGRVQY